MERLDACCSPDMTPSFCAAPDQLTQASLTREPVESTIHRLDVCNGSLGGKGAAALQRCTSGSSIVARATRTSNKRTVILILGAPFLQRRGKR